MDEPDRMAWFTRARLGIFVHWSLFSLGGRHEWRQALERTPADEYERWIEYFDPALYDAREWARLVRRSGAEYAVLTTKHHEGFCLFETAQTDFNAVRACGRDLVAEFVDACRAEGLRVGLYHSLLDWHHPDYTIDDCHPLRAHPDRDRLDAARDMAVYRRYLHAQVRELLTNYGTIDYLFFDFTFPDGHFDPMLGEHERGVGKGPSDWGANELLGMCRELQPDVVVNDRLGVGGDLATPEQLAPTSQPTVEGQPAPWEACQTITGHWGHQQSGATAKPADLLVRIITSAVAMDGNTLLNVGPTARGEISAVERDALEHVGEWMRRHERAIRGAGPSDFTPPNGVTYTQGGDRLYAHVHTWPFERLRLPGLAGRVRHAQFLHDATELADGRYGEDHHAGDKDPHDLDLRLPVQRPDVLVPVVELFLS